jgi:hypothetical protein
MEVIRMTNKEIPEHIRQEIEQAIDEVKGTDIDRKIQKIWEQVLK